MAGNRMCPRCRTTMEEREVAKVRVDGCHTCGGVWFDRDELKVLAQAGAAAVGETEADFAPAAARSRSPGWSLRCPVCSDPLRAFEYQNLPGLQMDGCDKCKGLWLDEGELAALVDRLGLK